MKSVFSIYLKLDRMFEINEGLIERGIFLLFSGRKKVTKNSLCSRR